MSGLSHYPAHRLHTKFSIGALRGHCNVAGFNQIASYLYGYPFGLDFARGYPRFNPGEYTMVDVLRDRDVDAAFVMCADLVCHIPADPASYLCEIPLVCLDIAPCPTTIASDVVLPGVIDAMECSGTFYRLDNVPVYNERVHRLAVFVYTQHRHKLRFFMVYTL